jgi:CRP-like cAMP-binding protein
MLVNPHLVKMLGTFERKFNAQLFDCMDIFSVQQLKEGEHWIKAGDSCEDFFYISEGILRLYYIDHAGNEINEGFYDEGELLGPISSYVNGSPCPYYIQALEPATLVVANYHKFHAYGFDRPEILRFEITFMHNLFVRNAKRDGKRILSSGEQRYRWFCREYPQFLERVPQYHIASFLGMNAVSLSRIRKQISEQAK